MDLALATLILSAALMIITGGTLAVWLLSDKPLVQVQVIAVVTDNGNGRPGRTYYRTGRAYGMGT